MAWPYIDRIDVKEVLRGKAPLGALIVLSIQHTYFRTPADGNELWLRRNTGEGYNVVRLGGDANPPRCSKNDAPASPYITPTAGKTFDDLERAGDAMFGHREGPSFISNFDN
jgi:hypothetical protein